jgi:hypothetical protein
VNEKIEGFFDVCKARGLSGEHGVLIPASNVKHLMLRQEIVDAAAAGKFHIYAVETIDQGIEILTGLPAGSHDENGKFPDGSINQRVERRLVEFAEPRAHTTLALAKSKRRKSELPPDPGCSRRLRSQSCGSQSRVGAGRHRCFSRIEPVDQTRGFSRFGGGNRMFGLHREIA